MYRYAFAHSPLSLKRSDVSALSGSPSVACTVLILWQAFTKRIVTKATPFQFIDGRSHMKKRRCRKTALSGYYACFSRDLLIMPSGADTHTHTHTRTHAHTHTRTHTHTHTHTHTQHTHTNVRGRNDFKKSGACGLWPRAPGLKIFNFKTGE